jgi:hypothetical protein
MANLSDPPRNSIGDRAGPRYQLTTFRVALRACEPCAKVDSPKAAVPVLRQILSWLDADQEHFILLALSTQLHITGYKIVSSGGLSSHHRRRAHPLFAWRCRSARPRSSSPTITQAASPRRAQRTAR